MSPEGRIQTWKEMIVNSFFSKTAKKETNNIKLKEKRKRKVFTYFYARPNQYQDVYRCTVKGHSDNFKVAGSFLSSAKEKREGKYFYLLYSVP
jgi:hypothetical protein